MPSIEQILSRLQETANAWQTLAILWHIFFAVLAVALVVGARPSRRAGGIMLALPMLSVSVVAWLSSNPFNGLIYALVGTLLVFIAARLPRERIEIAPNWEMIPGVAVLLFGWMYPHFLSSPSVLSYVYAAPTGLIPCPTLSIVIGFTLVIDRFQSRAYSLTLGLVGLYYGITGVAQLGVLIDLVLVAGAAFLVVVSHLRGRHKVSIGSDKTTATMTAWGIGPRLAGISIAYAAIALSVHYSNPDIMVMSTSSDLVLPFIGAMLVAIGLVVWVLGAVRIDKAFKEGRLLTSGVYAIVRNPMYCGFIVFVSPGIALLCRSWPLLTVPVVAYVVFKLLVVKEEKYLEGKFGQEYLHYKSRVNSIIPLVRFRH